MIGLGVFARLAAWASGLSLSGVLAFLSSPIGIVGLVVVAWFGGGWWHTRAANARCEARIEQSIATARAVDTKIATEAAARAAQDRQANEALASQLEKRIQTYAQQIKDAPACPLDQRDLDALGGVRSGPELPAVGPQPPRRR